MQLLDHISSVCGCADQVTGQMAGQVTFDKDLRGLCPKREQVTEIIGDT